MFKINCSLLVNTQQIVDAVEALCVLLSANKKALDDANGYMVIVFNLNDIKGFSIQQREKIDADYWEQLGHS